MFCPSKNTYLNQNLINKVSEALPEADPVDLGRKPKQLSEAVIIFCKNRKTIIENIQNKPKFDQIFVRLSTPS